MTDRSNEVAIVGGGIAGTVLAIACRQAGLAVRIYEGDAEPGALLEIVELTANGTRVLNALGLKQALAGIAVVPAFATTRSAASAFLISQRPLGGFSEARWGAPSLLVEAGALIDLLRRACGQESIPLALDAEVVGIDPEAGAVTLADGIVHRHLAVAVASGAPRVPVDTGAPEPLADLLERRQWQADPAFTVIRARARRPVPSRDHARFVNTWLMPGAYCEERPADRAERDQQVELKLVIGRPDAGAAVETDRPPAAAVLTGMLSGCHPHLRSLAESLLDAAYLDGPVSSVAGRWHGGRAVLLGGACHAPAPCSELAPSAAMEDAWVLSRMMERWEEEPHQDFAEYQRFREPRARRMAAYVAERTAGQAAMGGIWRRNLTSALTSRFLPEMVMQRLDWLYGYDCVKGFL